MNNNSYKRATGLFYSRDEAEAAIRALKQDGYDMDRVSVIARDADKLDGHETTEEVGNKADDGAAAGAVAGGRGRDGSDAGRRSNWRCIGWYHWLVGWFGRIGDSWHWPYLTRWCGGNCDRNYFGRCGNRCCCG